MSNNRAIVLTTEVLWSALLAVGVGQEPLTERLIVGGAIMFAAMVIIEWPSRGRKVLVNKP
jgi:drug/metabolite transporter (DMT)-like permease